MALSDRFQEALVFSTELHAAQVRKGTDIPYASHLLIVAGYVLDHGGSEDEAIAALLHDAVEDQGGLAVAKEIRERFGPEVEEIVKACSDAHSVPKPPWRERKEAYLRHLETVSPSVRRVSAADKLHNARAILRDLRTEGESLWERFNGGRDGTLWYYRSLADTFRNLDTGALAEELDRVVKAIERVAEAKAVGG